MSNQKGKQKDKKSELAIEYISSHFRNDRRYEEAISELLDKDRMMKQAEEKAYRLGMDLHEARVEISMLKKYIKEEM